MGCTQAKSSHTKGPNSRNKTSNNQNSNLPIGNQTHQSRQTNNVLTNSVIKQQSSSKEFSKYPNIQKQNQQMSNFQQNKKSRISPQKQQNSLEQQSLNKQNINVLENSFKRQNKCHQQIQQKIQNQSIQNEAAIKSNSDKVDVNNVKSHQLSTEKMQISKHLQNKDQQDNKQPNSNLKENSASQRNIDNLGVESKINKQKQKQNSNQKDDKSKLNLNQDTRDINLSKVVAEQKKLNNSPSNYNNLFQSQNQTKNNSNQHVDRVETILQNQNTEDLSSFTNFDKPKNIMKSQILPQKAQSNDYQQISNTLNRVSNKAYLRSNIQGNYGLYKHDHQDFSKPINNSKTNLQNDQDIDIDALNQKIDDQGPIKAPLQTSYHSNSKQRIATTEIRIVDKYLKNLQNQIIHQRASLSRDENSIELSKKNSNEKARINTSKVDRKSQVSQHVSFQSPTIRSNQQNKDSSSIVSSSDTAYFKNPSLKQNNNVSTKSQKPLEIIEQATNYNNKQKLSLDRKKLKKQTGPISFSEIDNNDSDFIPEEQNMSNNLGISVHLEINQDY